MDFFEDMKTMLPKLREIRSQIDCFEVSLDLIKRGNPVDNSCLSVLKEVAEELPINKLYKGVLDPYYLQNIDSLGEDWRELGVPMHPFLLKLEMMNEFLTCYDSEIALPYCDSTLLSSLPALPHIKELVVKYHKAAISKNFTLAFKTRFDVENGFLDCISAHLL